jgi:ribose transport system permease protein
MSQSTNSVRMPPPRFFGSRQQLRRLIHESGIFLALIILLVVGAMSSPFFLKTTNIVNVSRQIAIIGIVGIGMTFVILTSGIDLSVGATIGLVSVISGQMLRNEVEWPLALAAGLLAGAAVGAVNGIGITKGKLQPFIMTLGMMVIVRGITMTYTDGQPILIGRERAAPIKWLSEEFYGVPVPVWILLAIALSAAFILTYTPFGRKIYAVGDNVEAARLSGINTDWVIFWCYVLSGAMAAISALILVSRLRTGEPTQGEGFELDAIAIVVIGGTSLFGGEGTIRGTLMGAAIVAALANLLNLLGVSPFSQQIVKGLIIIGAVLIERYNTMFAERR